MFCLSFWTCCTRYRPLSCPSLPLLYVLAWVSSALGQIVGARGYCAWHCSASPPHPQTPSPVLVSLWMSRRKNPPPAFDRAAPREVSCIPTALGSLGFHTYTDTHRHSDTQTDHKHTPACSHLNSLYTHVHLHTCVHSHVYVPCATWCHTHVCALPSSCTHTCTCETTTAQLPSTHSLAHTIPGHPVVCPHCYPSHARPRAHGHGGSNVGFGGAQQIALPWQRGTVD